MATMMLALIELAREYDVKFTAGQV